MQQRFELKASRRLSAPRDAVFALLHSHAGLGSWWGAVGMPVRKKAGPDQGVGLVIAFEMGGHTTETWIVTAVSAPRSVSYRVEFAGMGSVERTIALEEDGGGTLATWREAGESQHPAAAAAHAQLVANFEMALGLLGKAAGPAASPANVTTP